MSSPSGPSQLISQTDDPSSNFKSMLDAALIEYKKKTGEDLQAIWLASELQTCESVDSVLDILRDQADALGRSGDPQLMMWIDPLVHVLHTFSNTLGDGVSLAFPPAKVIFTGIGVLLGAAKDARASQRNVIDLFERIESFFKRLEVYNQIALTTKMAEVLVKIVIELLSILSIATKEVKRRRAKLFARKLLGRADIEDALKRLDCLIQEEFQMVMAQVMKATTEIKDGAERNQILVQQMSNDIVEVKRDVVEVKSDVVEVKDEVVEVKYEVQEVKWAQIKHDIHKWFSPPDPYTNYNIACETQSEGTAAWFFRGKKFKDWISIGSLLWIHGKPGSGKSILCSALIKHVISLRDAGQASLAFFYFDFRDEEKKQDLRNFVTSLLCQLSACSSSCCEMLFRIYSTHGEGTQQPSNRVLTNCLREMLSVSAEQPIYIIVDALDECPNISGIPTPREVVLDLLEGLVRLGKPNLHICVTSRPEADVKDVLEPLARCLSLHNEIGQMKDISDYVSNFVSSDRMMGKWRSAEKELVVKELSTKADGMFRWVYCQLEVLRHCIPASIRQTLNQLPISLDDTYLRVLSQIPQANHAHAYRMLQCLVVAVRPLEVEELAELLAFDFDTSQGGIPRYRPALRLDNQTQAVLSTCSSLVTIIKGRSRPIVQFSHFSVKEFLVSNRLASSLGDISKYHIRLESAHIILTQACLGLLLHSDDRITEESVKHFPLARYAADHWFEHAQSEDVVSRVKDGMQTLFDPDKPHFETWVGLSDIDPVMGSSSILEDPSPLYYAVLCGFYDLVEHLAIKHPHYVNAFGGQYGFPLLAALGQGHFEITELLLKHGADVDVREATGKTLLLVALSWLGGHDNLINIVEFLLTHNADVNARDADTFKTSLHLAVEYNHRQVIPMLLNHKADVNCQDSDGITPLHLVWENEIDDEDGVLDHALLFLKHGADVNRGNNDNDTPLHLAILENRFKLVEVFLAHGADADAKNDNGVTPLHVLSESEIDDEDDFLDYALLLLKYGAEVNRRDNDNDTPLHLAILRDQFKLAEILLEHSADADAENNNGLTPLHILSERYIEDGGKILNLVPLLLKHGAAINSRNKNWNTPLHLAILRNRFELAEILLELGADSCAENKKGITPLHLLSECDVKDGSDILNIVLLLSKHGAAVNSRTKNRNTPLHRAILRNRFKLAEILLEHGADATAENNNGQTPLHMLSECDIKDRRNTLSLVLLLLKHGAAMDSQNKNKNTPLHRAILRNRFKLAEILLEHGADAHAQNNIGKSPLRVLSESCSRGNGDFVNHARSFLVHGVVVNRRNVDNKTSLLLGIDASMKNSVGDTSVQQEPRGYCSSLERECDLAWPVEYDADLDVEEDNQMTPTYLQSDTGPFQIAVLLLYYGANHTVGNNGGASSIYQEIKAGNGQDKNQLTPLHVASLYGWVKMVRVLLDRGATVNSENNLGQTPLHIVSEGAYTSQEDAVRIAQLLLKHGADITAQDNNHETPEDFARQHGKHELISLFHHYRWW